LIGKLFASDTFIALNKGLDAAALRQQAIANNIANVNTPGYKKQDVAFEDEFKRAVDNKYNARLRQTHPRHLPGAASASVDIKLNTLNSTSMRYDGNNVDVDEEMSKLAENSIRFNAMAQLLGGRFNSLRMVIEGRR